MCLVAGKSTGGFKGGRPPYWFFFNHSLNDNRRGNDSLSFREWFKGGRSPYWFFFNHSLNDNRRGNDSLSFWRFAACLLPTMSSIFAIGKPCFSTRRCHASSNRSIPSGAKIRSRSNGPFLS